MFERLKNIPANQRAVLAAAGIVCFASLIGIAAMRESPSKLSIGSHEVSRLAPKELGRVKLWGVQRPIKAGTQLSTVKLVPLEWSRNKVPEGAITDELAVRGLYAKRDIAAGVALTNSLLTDSISKADLNITPGYVAVAIPIADSITSELTRGVGRFVKVTFNGPKNDGRNNNNELVRRAKLLAVGNPGSPSKIVTIEVPRQDQNTIFLAQHLHQTLKISFINPLDVKAVYNEEAPPITKQATAKICGEIKVDGQVYAQLNCGEQQFRKVVKAEIPVIDIEQKSSTPELKKEGAQ